MSSASHLEWMETCGTRALPLSARTGGRSGSASALRAAGDTPTATCLTVSVHVCVNAIVLAFLGDGKQSLLSQDHAVTTETNVRATTAEASAGAVDELILHLRTALNWAIQQRRAIPPIEEPVRSLYQKKQHLSNVHWEMLILKKQQRYIANLLCDRNIYSNKERKKMWKCQNLAAFFSCPFTVQWH